MRTLVRTVIWLTIVLWLGGLLFFPVVAGVAFSKLSDTHAAGTVVGECLRVLHAEGLFAGALLMVLLIAATGIGIYSRRVLLGPLLMVVIMLGLTAFSQFSIIPRMEADRIAVGGAIDAAPASDPFHVDFNRLHSLSTHVEEGVMIAGLLLVWLLARAEDRPSPAAR
jgi:hypothetical protein